MKDEQADQCANEPKPLLTSAPIKVFGKKKNKQTQTNKKQD